MLNPLNILSKFIKTGNQKELDKIDKIVNQINILQKDIEVLGDDQFPKNSDYSIKELTTTFFY